MTTPTLWTRMMARLLASGSRKSEQRAADLAPLAETAPDKVEPLMAELEALSRRQGTMHISVHYRPNMRAPIERLVEGEDYKLRGGEVIMTETPPKGSYVGIRRYGENTLGIFDHTTWMPGAGAEHCR